MSKTSRQPSKRQEKTEFDSARSPFDKNSQRDPYGNEAMASFLEGYERITSEKACQRGPIDLKRVTVWSKRGKKWEPRRAVDLLRRKPRQSICRALVTGLYGWTNAQYEQVRDAFDDSLSNDVMGIYANRDGDYAIVGRLPLYTSKTALGAAGVGGALVGLAAKWGYDKKKNASIAWYRRYSLKVHRLRDVLYTEELQRLNNDQVVRGSREQIERMRGNPHDAQETFELLELISRRREEAHVLSEALKMYLMIYGFNLDRFESIDDREVAQKADAMSMVVESQRVLNMVVYLILDKLEAKSPTQEAVSILNQNIDILQTHGERPQVDALKRTSIRGINALPARVSERMREIIAELGSDFHPPGI